MHQDVKRAGCLLTTVRCSGKENFWEEFYNCIKVFLCNKRLRSNVKDTKLRMKWQWKGDSNQHRETGINSNIYRIVSKVMETTSSSCLTLSEESPLKYLVVWIFSAININSQENTFSWTVPWIVLVVGWAWLWVVFTSAEFGLVTEFPWESHLIFLLCPFTALLCFPPSPML